MTDKIDTPESVRMFARDLVPAIGHLFRYVEERDIGKMNLLLTLLERYAVSLEAKKRREYSRTHSDKCWMWHHECAVLKIERMLGETR